MLRVSCTNCHLPFILNREALGAALDEVEREGYKHYNAYCSNCGRPNKIGKKQLRRAAPWWTPPAAKAAGAKAKTATKSNALDRKILAPNILAPMGSLLFV